MIELIPAMDIIDGQVVRLKKGLFTEKTVYDDSPLEYAKAFEDAGVKRLHMVDLDGAKHGRPQNLAVLEKIASNTSLDIDFGGGLRDITDVDQALKAGAKYVNVGTAAASFQQAGIFQTWVNEYGPERFILAGDIKNGKVATSGWQQESMLDADRFISGYATMGIRQVMVTDISRDGTLSGMNPEFYREDKKQPSRYFPDCQRWSKVDERTEAAAVCRSRCGHHRKSFLFGENHHQGY
ncbi:MAG: 1-(5-phosphoribosyl)-5-[(5-phosphoribosylamino)methylideneamino] imidazole-4-carboxamide isomerase [Bacteroidales bacterium]|nr:1-(5-phosphoribosyl)-5-[(5-phosphoribosylamino)methylideneamino] imidazole-4-carboxamide isomerase [Bacteroidales bacterium]